MQSMRGCRVKRGEGRERQDTRVKNEIQIVLPCSEVLESTQTQPRRLQQGPSKANSKIQVITRLVPIHLKTTLTPLLSNAAHGKNKSCCTSTSLLVVSNNSCLSNRLKTVARARCNSAFASLDSVSRVDVVTI